jgi:hypothetical protein
MKLLDYTPPAVEQPRAGNYWRLTAHHVVTWEEEGIIEGDAASPEGPHRYAYTRRRLLVPEGYDFQPSIWRLFWPVVAPCDVLGASGPHDFVSGSNGDVWSEVWVPTARDGRGAWRRVFGHWSYRQWQRLFAAVNRAEGVPWWRRLVAQLGVEVAGPWAWYVTGPTHQGPLITPPSPPLSPADL